MAAMAAWGRGLGLAAYVLGIAMTVAAVGAERTAASSATGGAERA